MKQEGKNERVPFTREIAERDERIAALERTIRQKDALIQQVGVSAVQVHHQLARTRASLAWRLLLPLRLIGRLWAHVSGKRAIDLIPFHQLRAQGAEWLATGNDPQFLLLAESDWYALAGWYWLEVDVACAQPLNACLYFDLGAGFDPQRVICFHFYGEGRRRIPLCVPVNCRAIRLDPCDSPTRFRLSGLLLTRLSAAPHLPPEFAEQLEVFDALARRGVRMGALEPVNAVQQDTVSGYVWRSDGVDPWFTVRDVARDLRPGWHMVELCIRTDAAGGIAKLYFDHGEGYSESNALQLPYASGEVVCRLCHVKAVPRQVRLDPLEEAAGFSVDSLRFEAVMPMFARNHMLRRVCERHAHHQGQRMGCAWMDLKAQAKARQVAVGDLLYRRYGETFITRSARKAIDYAEWIARVEGPAPSDPELTEKARKLFTRQPTISVLMPVFNTVANLLRRAVESVLAQSYPHWEFCIADDASTEPHVRAVLQEYLQRDARIKVVFRPENGHISAASNSALALASGEFVALMDHDDELAPHALHFVAGAIDRHPSAQVLYGDEDKINEVGERSDPHFKPDWSPDLFFSQNYVSHLGVYRRDLLERIGGFRTGVEGSQDQDLLLRCLPHVKASEIVHIPGVLYHWRMADGSTAFAAGEKHYTTEAGIKALRDFFAAQDRADLTVEAGLAPNTYRVKYPIPQPEPLVSLLIPTRDTLEFLEPCVRSILEKTAYPSYEIVIIDNESVDPATLEYFRRIATENERVRVLPYHHPFNFSAINNYGVRHARGEVIGLVNNDIEVISPEWLSEMVSHALRPEIGCVGAKLYYDDDTIQHAGVILGIGGVAGHSHKYFSRADDGYFSRLKIVQNVSAVTGACLVVRKSVYEEVGGLEENGLGVAFNDVDFCLKVREAGYRNLWTPYAELYHHESKSRGIEDSPAKVERFHKEVEFIQAKWGETLLNDPYYSRNLTLVKEDFSLL